FLPTADEAVDCGAGVDHWRGTSCGSWAGCRNLSGYARERDSGTGCRPSMSVNPYSCATAAATRTWPDFRMTPSSEARAATARPTNCGDSEFERSKYSPAFITPSVRTRPG